MILTVQVLTSLFVLFSLSLVVAVPVSLAIPGRWEVDKSNFYKSTTLWITLVFFNCVFLIIS
uniref:Photosystem II reaction center protein Z n=1 Tax=Choristocarpus tenellus TaxID=116065 RepID=UPI002E75AA6A|nr:Photosystem II reaction center protein Z [Choristocarpus tenellus]WAM62366.1 Photosystem II reaction center protein Z [Choristocarpus tenellus]